MTKIEFERKFVLDLRKLDGIYREIKSREPHLIYRAIRQCYDNGDRYRATETHGEIVFLKENKKSVKLGTPYSVNIEEEEEISAKEFQKRWNNATKRLQKSRYEVVLAPSYQQSMMVDFFHTGPDERVYAIVAEVEMILDANSHALAFGQLLPPLYLIPYILKSVDNADQDSKAFKSINMIDTPESIANIERAYQELYDKSI